MYFIILIEISIDICFNEYENTKQLYGKLFIWRKFINKFTNY